MRFRIFWSIILFVHVLGFAFFNSYRKGFVLRGGLELCVGEREVVGQPHLVILKTKTIKWSILTLFEIIFWNRIEHFENFVAKA